MEEKIIFETEIDQGEFAKGGEASSKLKSILHKLGVASSIIRKVAIITYELEMNIIIHSWGGSIKAVIRNRDKYELVLHVEDKGPGIKDIEKVFQPGFSTASDEIRELGFGAGMGLNNVKNYSDQLDFNSTRGEGTCIEVKVEL